MESQKQNSELNDGERKESFDSEIDVGIEATTLPPVDFKKEIQESSDQMFDSVRDYLSSEIEGMVFVCLSYFK